MSLNPALVLKIHIWFVKVLFAFLEEEKGAGTDNGGLVVPGTRRGARSSLPIRRCSAGTYCRRCYAQYTRYELCDMALRDARYCAAVVLPVLSCCTARVGCYVVVVARACYGATLPTDPRLPPPGTASYYRPTRLL
eukprot:1759464-Rhodomonas_salina.1